LEIQQFVFKIFLAEPK